MIEKEMQMARSYLSRLECTECGGAFPADFVGAATCHPRGTLLARYDLAAAAREINREEIGTGPSSLWRYASLLPVKDVRHAVSLVEGWTPLVNAARLGDLLGCAVLYIKDEGRNPTGSFKDRGATVGVSRYRELGIDAVILNSSGNAGAAWSVYSARAGMHCVSIVPRDIQPASLSQCALAGAETYVIEDWHRSGSVVAELAAEHGWLNVGTLKEPYRIEGKKTIGYELAEQLGWKMPDVIFYPLGGGTGAIAIWKAFEELQALGWVHGRVPRLFITQYEGCAPVVRAFQEEAEDCTPWRNINIPPGGLKSPNPPGGKQVLRLIRGTGGGALAVSTAQALDAVARLAREEGVFACPESATTLAGLTMALERGLVSKGESVVLISTGSGLKSVPSLPVPSLKTVG
ncbi:MAG TPA: threonine synthase [Casimicrobiaceae bacterium]|nr:threonine synthase [Casimicrobiaceae bacterium]